MNKPRPEDFDYLSEYIAALADFNRGKTEAETKAALSGHTYTLELSDEERDTFLKILDNVEPHTDKEHALIEYFYSQLVAGYEIDQDD